MVPGKGVETLGIGDSHGDVDANSLSRAMIRQTIEHHFKKELRNRPLGIKTLSLFFLEAVKDYREYENGEGKPGPLAVIFEEEYAKQAISRRTGMVLSPSRPSMPLGNCRTPDRARMPNAPST